MITVLSGDPDATWEPLQGTQMTLRHSSSVAGIQVRVPGPSQEGQLLIAIIQRDDVIGLCGEIKLLSYHSIGTC